MLRRSLTAVLLLGALALPTSALAATATLTVHRAAQGVALDTNGGTVAGEGIACPSDCAETYTLPHGSVTLTPTDANGWTFASWTGCDSEGVGNTCTVSVGADRAVTVNFSDVGDPTVSLAGPKPSGSKVAGTINLGAAAADNAGVAQVEFFVNGAGNPFATDTTFPYQASLNTAAGLPDGPIQLTAKVTDINGRVGFTTSSLDYTVDNHTSAANFIAPSPDQNTVTQANDFTYAWNGLDADVSSVQCALDPMAGPIVLGNGPGEFQACTTTTTQTITDAPEGVHTLVVLVTDDVGNQAQSSRTFRVDTTPPTLTVARPAQGAILSGFTTPEFATNDAGGDPTVTCKLDSGAFGACTGLAPGDGAHTLTVHAVDPAGNVAEVSRTFTIDSQPPVVTIAGGEVDFTFSVTDATGVTIQCSLDGAAFGACPKPSGFSATGLPAGDHTMRVRATDAAGNTSTKSRTFTVAPAAAPLPGGTPGPVGATPDTLSVRTAKKVSLRKIHRRLRVTIVTPKSGVVYIELRRHGKRVLRRQYTAQGGTARLVLRLSRKTKTGFYVIRLTQGKRLATATLRIRK